jgi:hypothetical protein
MRSGSHSPVVRCTWLSGVVVLASVGGTTFLGRPVIILRRLREGVPTGEVPGAVINWEWSSMRGRVVVIEELASRKVGRGRVLCRLHSSES